MDTQFVEASIIYEVYSWILTNEYAQNYIDHNSVGKVLSSARMQRALSLTQVAQITKIREEALRALEEGNFSYFSSETYLKGLLKNYANFLEVDSEKLAALYRKQSAVHAKVVAEQTKQQSPKLSVNLSSRLGLLLIGFLLLLAGGWYVINQINSVLQPPELQLSLPQTIAAPFNDEITLNTNSFEVTGHTSPQTIVKLNSEPLDINAAGDFHSDTIPLSTNGATLVLTATNQFGKNSQITLHVLKSPTYTVEKAQ